ncbi:MAG: sensor domain-containing diguanylate cyclase [Candidatus Nanopelagicales bacterium]
MSRVWGLEGLSEAALEHLYNAVVITDADFSDGGPRIVECNAAFCAMTGYTREELIGVSPRILQGPDTDPVVIERLRVSIRAGAYFEGATVNYRKDGQPYSVQWNISPVRVQSQEITHFVSVQEDVSARLNAERERDLLAQAVQLARDPIMVTDDQMRISFVNSAFEQALGYSSEEVVGRTAHMLYQEAQGASVYDEIVAALSVGDDGPNRVSLRAKDGSVMHAMRSAVAVRSEVRAVSNYVVTFTDVTELVVQHQRLQQLATTDALTGLFNRRAGEAELRRQLHQAVQSQTQLSVLMLDIDHFKRINDQFGHAAGDDVLQLVSQAMRASLRGQDAPVRWGGEEFLVVLPGASTQSAAKLAERMRAAIAGNVQVDGSVVTVSVGVSQARGGDTVASLVERADQAMYRAKAAGRDQVAVSE